MIMLIGFLSYQWIFQKDSSSQYREDFAIGKHLSNISDLNERKYETSIILILDTNCKYCNESIDFYKKLEKSDYNKNTKQLVALFAQNLDVVSKYGKENEFTVRSIASVDFIGLKVGITPTIVVINTKRKIIKSWFGKLKSEQEQEIINLLEN